jgi:membrane fusion protein (multidrug efflux system)
VLAALAMRDKAAWQLAQTTVTAPADGVVSQAASFKLGQYVSAGTALFSLVETGDAWVEANFKETQLTHMRPGQPVEVEVDAYPGAKLKGHVDSLQSGTGARFSLLPPENATGNYVKVVQRIPVRIVFDRGQDPDHLLRLGMSVEPNVRVR